MGTLEQIPTDDTPGISASLWEISSSMRTTFSSSFASALTIETRKVCNAAGPTNPGLTLVRAAKVRIIRPEQINKTSARAMLLSALTEGAATLADAGAESRPGVLEDGNGSKQHAGEE